MNFVAMEELARKILLHSRRRISHIAPILLEAVYAMPEKVRSTIGPLSTDGAYLWFAPETVVEDFREDRDSVARQLLHVTLHCLLGHLEQRSSFPVAKAFDCAADLKTAQLADGLCGVAFAVNSSAEDNDPDFRYIPYLRPLYESLTPRDDDYCALRQRDILRKRAKAVRFDDHTLWIPVVMESVLSCDAASGGKHQTGGNGEVCTDGTATPDWAQIRQSMLNGRTGKLPGSCAGMLQESFAVAERGLSYGEFLKRFAFPAERMLLDPDSFDVRWYHLGLEYYGNLPLLEPFELSEPPLPDDIVIALDTSGSCCGDVCKRFLKETLGLLRDLSAGATRFRVWMMQCDTRIQKEVLLESSEQVEELFRNFEAKGFGGTDFRPVFKRVEELRQNGTLPCVRGLFYLTDGLGSYPDQPADYPVVFLIPAEDRGCIPRYVEWITCLYLNKTDFTVKEAAVI